MTRALYRSLILSFGLVLFALSPARADTAVEDDCLEADPRYSVEACAWALFNGGERTPDEIFRINTAAGNAELARGKPEYALLDFGIAFDAVKKNGAKPGDQQYADVLALAAIAELRSSDPAAAAATLADAEAKDAANSRLPVLKAYTHFAAGDAASAVNDIDAMLAASPSDQSLVALKTMFEHWQLDPAAAVAECQKYYSGSECGSGALALHENDKAAADLVASVLGVILKGDVPRMSREEAPGAWSDCEAPEPEYAGPGCEQILGGDITPEERYAASVRRIVAAIHNDDAGTAIEYGERLLGRLDYGAARAPEDDPGAVRAHALLVQAHLARGETAEAGEVVDAALADQPDDPTYLALRALVDLAAGNASDSDANLALAEEAAGSDGPPEIAALAELVTAIDSDLADGVARCQATYSGAGCGSTELTSGDTAGAMLAIATDINATFLGDAGRPFTLIGVDRLP